MKLIPSWRWFGDADPVSLQDLKQLGVRSIVSALHHIPVGEVWSVAEIKNRQAEIASVGLSWDIVESVNIHEQIKLNGPDADHYIENYQQTIRNLSACGIHVLCYNFMPVLDWTRTDLKFKINGGGESLRFDMRAFIAFDVFILERNGARESYTLEQLTNARQYLDGLSNQEREALRDSILAGLPGTTEVFTPEAFLAELKKYEDISAEKLKTHLANFLKAVIPVAEQEGVKMCIHPDDPPFSLFGLPRIVSNSEDLCFILNAVDSPYNGITFCSGSLGANPNNDLNQIVRDYGHRFPFVHLRNVQHEGGGSFHEGGHLDGSTDMVALIKNLLAVGGEASVYYRPDHGHQLLDDLPKQMLCPGYSTIGRLKGLSELRGVIAALMHE
ncbi:mannonate dehydratase [Persicobacter diffluens]|uniref:Mannonate dehydratase n=1 Tax=Persicobacter diffluens TaxID=981 RepID=A0AAN5APJ0_9BACT|nr:mannonate dehydratase [Persicobacter diffluens]